MLTNSFGTGTQKAKSKIPKPPEVKKLIPFRDMDLSSDVSKIKIKSDNRKKTRYSIDLCKKSVTVITMIKKTVQ